MREKFYYISPKDFLASLVVFIVAVPLSLGIAVSVGTSVESGLIAAVIGGVVVGLLAGSPLMASGPAAGLIVLAYQVGQKFGIQGLFIATAICGVLQITFGLFRIGWMFNLIPKYVLHGMLAAIGAIILLGQLHVLMGQPAPNNPVTGIFALGGSLSASINQNGYWLTPVFFCGIIAVAVQVAWPKIFPKMTWIPGALPAVVIVTFISMAWDMDRLITQSLIPVVTANAKFFFDFGWLDQLDMGGLFGSAFGMAIVASAESLLTARATDLMEEARDPDKPHKRKSNLDQELIAQGTGNLTSGIVGGLPITGVIVRSSANINAGGETRWSTIFHGIWVLLFVLLAPDVLSKIPLTALAAVLVVTGFKLLDIHGLIEAFKHDKVEGVVWSATIVAIIATNLLRGLMISLALTVIIHLVKTFIDTPIEERAMMFRTIMERVKASKHA